MEDEEYQEHKRILDKTTGKLKDWMIPDLIIDADHENKIFGYREKRDIQEQKTTTEKNDLILKIVRRKNKNGYKDFIEILHRSGQGKLVEFLTRTENGHETGEIERHLDEMAKESLNLSHNYFKLKSDLKKDMINFYHWRHSKVPLSPLFEEKDTPLKSFYVRPEIIEKTSRTEDKMPKMKSLSDMFESGSNADREIYLTADAGLGKTTFSKYLAISWCHAHCTEEGDVTSLEKDDVDFMRKFEFVFLILLRNSSSVSSIDDLIFELIFSELCHAKNFDKNFLQEILNNEKCLVILDGLDEWTHPSKNPVKPCYRKPELIPHRNDRENCTVLTTTRPWKLGVLNSRNSNESGKHVALTKLKKANVVALTKSTLQRLKSLPNEDSLKIELNEFNKEINARGIADLASVPLLLMYITCLWCDGVPTENSKHGLYVEIVELFFSRTTAKHEALQSSSKNYVCGIPECFNGHDHCNKYFRLISALGKLAYHTLFKTNGNSLVFDRSLAEKYLEAEELKFCLLSGILTESITKTLLKRMSKVSFLHETLQEFFAAIFISSQSDGQKIVLDKCKTVESILNMSIVFEFISGINAPMMCEIIEGFRHVICKDRETRECTSRTDWEVINWKSLYNIQDMLLSCLREMPESENFQLYLHDLVIAGESEQDLKRLSKLHTNNISTLSIDTCMTSSSLGKIIKLSSLSDLLNLQKLWYIGEVQDAEVDRLLLPSLQSLYLCDQWTRYEGNLNERLEQIQNLKYLHIRKFTFSHEILETFINLISSTKTLNEVILSELCCDKHDSYCEKIKVDLSKHSKLTKIELESLSPLQLNITTPSLIDVTLWDINLYESLLLSPEMLHIKRVELYRIEMSAESLQKNIQVLEYLLHSVGVEIDECFIKPEPERKRLENYIRSSNTFHVTREDCVYNENEGWTLAFYTKQTNE